MEKLRQGCGLVETALRGFSVRGGNLHNSDGLRGQSYRSSAGKAGAFLRFERDTLSLAADCENGDASKSVD